METTTTPNTKQTESTLPRDEMMTIDEVRSYVGGGRPPNSATIYRWIQDAQFPKPFKLSHRCARWRKREVDAWLKTRRQ